eukprot:COSAG02_NODE_55894_length_288_cov_0.798942_1_plen_37_part_10
MPKYLGDAPEDRVCPFNIGIAIGNAWRVANEPRLSFE